VKRERKRIAFAMGVLVTRARVVLALACAIAAPSAHPANGLVEVRAADSKFTPERVEVRVGTTVRWINADKRTSHSVIWLGPAGFESERFFPGESYERKFEKPGAYPYGCGPHPEMRGVVVVTE
jgi:plastocyanin